MASEAHRYLKFYEIINGPVQGPTEKMSHRFQLNKEMSPINWHILQRCLII